MESGNREKILNKTVEEKEYGRPYHYWAVVDL